MSFETMCQLKGFLAMGCLANECVIFYVIFFVPQRNVNPIYLYHWKSRSFNQCIKDDTYEHIDITRCIYVLFQVSTMEGAALTFQEGFFSPMCWYVTYRLFCGFTWEFTSKHDVKLCNRNLRISGWRRASVFWKMGNAEVLSFD